MAVTMSLTDYRKLTAPKAPRPRNRTPREKPERKSKPAPERVKLDVHERLLSLDVSSSAVGWAIVAGDGTVERCGLIKPPAGWDSLRRIDAILERLAVELRGAMIDRTVMEWQSHKHAGRMKNAQGLAVLGQAQGAVWHWLRAGGYGPVETISEREWTGSRPKDERAATVAMLVPHYRADMDAGMDTADAIGLALWRLGLWPKRESTRRPRRGRARR